MRDFKVEILSRPDPKVMPAIYLFHPGYEDLARKPEGAFDLIGVAWPSGLRPVRGVEPQPRPPSSMGEGILSSIFDPVAAADFVIHAAWVCGCSTTNCAFTAFRHDGCWALEKGSEEIRWLPHSWMTAHERIEAVEAFLERHGKTLRRILDGGSTEDGSGA